MAAAAFFAVATSDYTVAYTAASAVAAAGITFWGIGKSRVEKVADVIGKNYLVPLRQTQ